jgi:hypothetical protein
VLNTTALDRETTPILHVNLTVANRDGLHGTPTSLKIILLDINDNTPIITHPTPQTSQYTVDENSLAIQIPVTATDPDNSYNGTVFYRLQAALNTDAALKSHIEK